MANLISGSYNQRSRFLKRLKNKHKDIIALEGDTEKTQILFDQIKTLDKELKGYSINNWNEL